jgi:hypothetical protein
MLLSVWNGRLVLAVPVTLVQILGSGPGYWPRYIPMSKPILVLRIFSLGNCHAGPTSRHPRHWPVPSRVWIRRRQANRCVAQGCTVMGIGPFGDGTLPFNPEQCSIADVGPRNDYFTSMGYTAEINSPAGTRIQTPPTTMQDGSRMTASASMGHWMGQPLTRSNRRPVHMSALYAQRTAHHSISFTLACISFADAGRIYRRVVLNSE